MKLRKLAIVAGLLVASLQLAACAQSPAKAAGGEKIQPALLEKTDDPAINRVVLVEKAAQRLDIQTADVREEQVGGAQHMVVPYAAVIYGNEGETWMYTSPEPLKFVRVAINIDHIEGDKVVLVDGPPAGTKVVTVGVAELYGIDTGIGK
jgi:hypothetical protein